MSFTLFCSVKLGENPYDTSLMGLSTPRQLPRGESFLSNSAWENETLKNEISYLCRHPDAGPCNGELYWSSNSSLLEQPVQQPRVECPVAMRAKPVLRIDTGPASIRPEIHHDSTRSSGQTSPAVSPLSHTSGRSCSSTTSEVSPETPACPILEIPELPDIPERSAKRLSGSPAPFIPSGDGLFPREFSASPPLSADPEILALSSPAHSTKFQSDEQNCKSTSAALVVSPPAAPVLTVSSESDLNSPRIGSPVYKSKLMKQPIDPSPVVYPLSLSLRKPPTPPVESAIRSIHHPHHPNYTLPASRSSSEYDRCYLPPMNDDHGVHQNNRHLGHSRIESTDIHPSYFERPQTLRQSENNCNYPRKKPRSFHSQYENRRFDPSRSLPTIPQVDDIPDLDTDPSTI
jgi:hypothetical protein